MSGRGLPWARSGLQGGVGHEDPEELEKLREQHVPRVNRRQHGGQPAGTRGRRADRSVIVSDLDVVRMPILPAETQPGLLVDPDTVTDPNGSRAGRGACGGCPHSGQHEGPPSHG
jgi:hypothetical protein